MDKNTTMVFPAPLMSTIAELGAFLARETAAAAPIGALSPVGATNGTVTNGTVANGTPAAQGLTP